MSVARVTEIIATGDSYEDAVSNGVNRAEKTLKNIKSAWVCDHSVDIKSQKISQHRVRLKVTFVLDD